MTKSKYFNRDAAHAASTVTSSPVPRQCDIAAQPLSPKPQGAPPAGKNAKTRDEHSSPATTATRVVSKFFLPASPPAAPREQACPRCAAPLLERMGKWGVFAGCTGFPRCRYMKSLRGSSVKPRSARAQATLEMESPDSFRGTDLAALNQCPRADFGTEGAPAADVATAVFQLEDYDHVLQFLQQDDLLHLSAIPPATLDFFRHRRHARWQPEALSETDLQALLMQELGGEE
eukprot:gene18952-22647_t